MCCESSNVVRFDLHHLLQGGTRIAKLKSAYKTLIIGAIGLGKKRVAQMETLVNKAVVLAV